ncbi:MAG: glycosyltransferase [Candidatus Micrarchaeia archaeon]
MLLEYLLAFLALYVSVFFLLVYLQNEQRLNDPKPKRFPSLTIIVPAYNEERNIAACLRSVLALRYPTKPQVIVVNDGSTDRTGAIARRFPVTVIDKPNTGKADSLNVALKRARGELIAVLDADSRVAPDAAEKMVGYFDDPEVMAVTPVMKVRGKGWLRWAQRGEYLFNAFSKKLLSFIDAVTVTPGPFSIYRRKVFKELGGFDIHTLTEDQEMALRIQRANYRIAASLEALVFTEAPDSIGELWRQRKRWYLGFLQNIWKHRALLSPGYGDLGLFVLPVSLALVLLTVASFLLNAYKSMAQPWAWLPSAPWELVFLELTPLHIVYVATFVAAMLGVAATLKGTREGGMIDTFLSLSAASFLMVIFWSFVFIVHVLNWTMGVKPVWKGE